MEPSGTVRPRQKWRGRVFVRITVCSVSRPAAGLILRHSGDGSHAGTVGVIDIHCEGLFRNVLHTVGELTACGISRGIELLISVFHPLPVHINDKFDFGGASVTAGQLGIKGYSGLGTQPQGNPNPHLRLPGEDYLCH